MKKILFFCVAILANLGIANAALPIGGYVGLRGGLSVKSQDLTKGDFKLESEASPFVSANAGIRLLKFRGELEYIYRNKIQEIKLSTKSKDVSTTSLMANLYYNVISIPFARLYINGGLGYTDFSTNYINTNNTFTYSLGLGASFTLAEAFSIDAGYRYFDMGKVKISGRKDRIYANDLYVGLRFGF